MMKLIADFYDLCVCVPKNLCCFHLVHRTSHVDRPMVERVAVPWHLKPELSFYLTEITVNLSYQDQ
jgi:hypothetical protein